MTNVAEATGQERALDSWGRALSEGIDDAVFVHDLQGRFLEANPAACRRLGYTREELLRLTTRDIDEPEFAAGFKDRLQQQLNEGRANFEGRHRTKDGRIIAVDINTSAIEYNGQPCVLAVMRDITERKQAEVALRKQTDLLRSILDNMGDGVLVADENETLLTCNPAAEHLFGLRAADAGRRVRLSGLFLPDMLTPFPEDQLPLRRCIRGEHVDDVEVFVRPAPTHEGFWASVTGRPLRDENGVVKGGIIVCHDITERKRAERRQATQYAVARVLAESTTLEEVTPAILKILCKGLGWDLAALWVLNRPTAGLRCVEVWHRPEIAADTLTSALRQSSYVWGAGLPGRVWAGAEPQWVADLAAEPDDPLGPALAASGLRGVLLFPIWSRGETTGVLGAFVRSPKAPDEELLSIAGTLGSQIGQILKRQQVEKELRESQAFYHSLVESLPLHLLRKDREGRLTFGNLRFLSTLNRTLAEVIGKTDYDLYPHELAAKYRADDLHVLATGDTLETVEAHHLPDGSKLYVQIIKTPISDAQGRLIGTQVMFWDVTARHRAEEELSKSEHRYRRLTEATLDAIIVADQDGRVQLFNPAAERLFGYQAAEVVGQPLQLLMPSKYQERYEQAVQRYVRTRVATIVGRTVELDGRRKDGTEFPVEVALSAIDLVGEAEPGSPPRLQFLGALRDLTERNRIRSVLVQNEKLASIGMLSAGVAHEINNPLAFIGNNLAVLERDIKGVMELLNLYDGKREMFARVDPEAAAQAAERAEAMDLGYIRDNLGRLLTRTREGVDRVTRIVHSLRGLARTDKPRMQETLLPDLVDISLEMIRSRLKRASIAVETSYDEHPVVRCMSTQISQVLLNLLVNAVQAVETAHRGTAGKVRVTVRRQDPDMLIEVADNGTGIAPEHQSRLFDPFFTTKEVGEGTGLGLSISHNIVTAHGGRIEVKSVYGEGTAFRVFLPLISPRESV